jgi:hypothetical protein
MVLPYQNTVSLDPCNNQVAVFSCLQEEREKYHEARDDPHLERVGLCRVASSVSSPILDCPLHCLDCTLAKQGSGRDSVNRDTAEHSSTLH